MWKTAELIVTSVTQANRLCVCMREPGSVWVVLSGTPSSIFMRCIAFKALLKMKLQVL